MKTVALLNGGNWSDASVDILDIPDHINIDEVKVKWYEWYNNEYVPNFNGIQRVKYKSLMDFLLELGAKKSDIEFYDV